MLRFGTLTIVCALWAHHPIAIAWGQLPDQSTPNPTMAVDRSPAPRGLAPVTFQPDPRIILLASLGPSYNNARISDLAIEDIDHDGCRDILVAWFATHASDLSQHQRWLTIFYGDCNGNFDRGTQINLYIRDTANFQRSIFANGTAAMALGDFDGDGDKDIAVTAYFGDEIWFIENLGSRNYTPRYKHVFGINTAGNFMTPPRAVAGDIDGDGRDELAYIIDPINRYNFVTIAFWKTSTTLANITRRTWEGADPGFVVAYTRGLDIADLDGDGRADLVFTGVQSAGQELMPAVSLIWHGFDASAQTFITSVEFPTFVCSDVAAVHHPELCDPTLVYGDRNGTMIESWDSSCGTSVDYVYGESEEQFATYALDRGIAVVAADVNEDGLPDIVTRQKSSDPSECAKVEIALAGSPGADWTRLPQETLNSCGFDDTELDQILRPRNLAVGDLFWNSAPEIVAGFGPTSGSDLGPGLGRLEIAIWPNSCRADISHDGQTDLMDLSILLAGLGCAGDPQFLVEADLDHNGCTDLSDLTLLLADFGCHCCPN